uniref:Uncharacterized protein n=1 Tax=Rhizophagus irregularis (strain DAOM 181602 / DAOM 197198 / MUCL 43194) TaxID=747089 RepID=U9U8B7_RHIID
MSRLWQFGILTFRDFLPNPSFSLGILVSNNLTGILRTLLKKDNNRFCYSQIYL